MTRRCWAVSRLGNARSVSWVVVSTWCLSSSWHSHTSRAVRRAARCASRSATACGPAGPLTSPRAVGRLSSPRRDTQLAIQADQQLALFVVQRVVGENGVHHAAPACDERWRLGRRTEAQQAGQRAGRHTEHPLGCEHVLDGRGGGAMLPLGDRALAHTDGLAKRTLVQPIPSPCVAERATEQPAAHKAAESNRTSVEDLISMTFAMAVGP